LKLEKSEPILHADTIWDVISQISREFVQWLARLSVCPKRSWANHAKF
jgi:hypothetical protein